MCKKSYYAFSTKMQVAFFLMLISLAFGQYSPNYAPGHAGIVQLFEWHWDTIAKECEDFLGPNKFGGVQISPPNENNVINGRPWWERYQPVSYKLITRSGNKSTFINMVDRCNAVGVRIYADIVVNHMVSALAGKGHGTDGSIYDAATRRFPAVPYSLPDFHNISDCTSSTGGIEDYNNPVQVRNCELNSLLDLDQRKTDVREKIVTFMNNLISFGVAGFRIDAAKHMWPVDLQAIFHSLNNLPTNKGFAPNTKPFIFQEVADEGGGAVTPDEYFSLGRVSEFKYGFDVVKNKDKIQYLTTLGESWNMMPNKYALIFLSNHDTERSNPNVITFRDSYDLKIFTAYMMAYNYGVPRVLSSYKFTNKDQGPPSIQPKFNSDGSCGNGWVCEHRWRQIKNMFAFAAAADGEPVANVWTSINRLAFSRGNKTFIAINKQQSTLRQSLQTGMSQGQYCNVIAGNVGLCSGSCISVDSNGHANFTIPPGNSTFTPVVAIHVNAPCN